MGILNRVMRMVAADSLPVATRTDLRAWAGREAAERSMLPVRTFRTSDIAEHWAEDPDVVARYAAMDTPIPPILVRTKDGRLVIVDGNHRYNAALARGQTEFDAINMDDL